MRKINTIIVIIILSITTLYASVINITNITGSSNTNSNYPAANLIDANLQTFWQTNTGSSTGYVEITLESESFIYGMEIENRLLADTWIDVQFNENGQWHSFAGAGQKNVSNTVFIDLSYEQIVCSSLRLVVTGQNLEYGNIAEIKITGQKAGDVYYKIAPTAVTTDDRFTMMSEPVTMFDGNIHSYWETLAYYKKWKIPAKIQELLEDIRSNINLPLRFTSQVDIELGGGKTIDLVKVFLRDDSTGIITFKVLQGSKWVSLYEIKTPLRSGWYRITVPESLKNMDKVRVVLSGSGLTSGGIGEIEFWGKGGYKAVSYNYITEGIDLNGIEQLFFNLDKQENINLEVVTTGVEIQPIELLMNGFVLHTNNYLTIGANRVYKILVDAVYLWEDVNVLQAKGIEGNNDKLIGVRIRNNPDTGLQTIDVGPLFDGILAAQVDLDSQTIISFDKVYEIEKLEIINRTGNSCGVELSYKGDYSSVTLTAQDEIGVAFLSGSKADGIRLTSNGNNPCEIRIYGSIAKNNTPSFRVLVPDQKERKHDFLFHFSRNEERLTNVKYITGYVDDVNAKVYVNGQLTEMKDHFFKISVESLNLIRGANNILRVEAVNESGSNIQEVVFFLKDNNLLIIDQPDKVVYTKDSQVVISGKTNSPGCYLKIQGQIVRFTSNKFSANASLAFGFNLVVIELYRNNSNELLKRVYRRFIRTGNFDIVIQEPKSNTITNSSSIIVKGILTKAVNVTITAAIGTNNYNVTLSNMIFTSQAIPLVEGENWITVTAKDSDGNKVTKTVSVKRDTTAPIVSITSPANGFVTNNGLVSVTGAVTEAAAAAVFINGKAAMVSSNSYTGTIELTGDGNHVITVEAQDAAGNKSTPVSVTVVLDQTPPAAFAVIPGTIGWTANARPVIEFAAVDGLSGIDYYELSIDKAAKQKITSPYQLPVLSDGERQIEVFAYDKAGNFKVGYAVVFIDTTPPAPPEGFTAIPGITTNKVIWKDRVSEIASYKIYRTPAFSSGAFKNIVRTETTPITGEYEDNETVVGQFYSYNISAIDYAGNIGALCVPQLIQTGRAEEPVSTAGGSVYFEDLKLDVRENTFDTGDTVVIQVQTEPRPENQFAEAVTPIYSVLRIDESNTVIEEDFPQPVKLEFNYDELVIPAGYDPSNLGVYWYNEALEVWERLPNVVVDYLNKSISVETTHFTDYQTMASNYSAPNLSEYDKYNPFGGYFAKNTESVSAQSGTVNLSCRDIELKGKDGFDLVIERSYSSGAAEAETRNPSTPTYYSFPAGWSINIASIETREEGKYLRLESGQEIKIDLKSGTTWAYHDGVHLSLNVIKVLDSKNKEVISEYHVTMKDGTVYKFWADGRIYDKTSPSGLLNIEYAIDAASKRISTITDTLGRIVTFEYSTNSLIESIYVKMAGDDTEYYNLTYSYNSDKHLTGFTDALNRLTSYEYTLITGKNGYIRQINISVMITTNYSDGTSRIDDYDTYNESIDNTHFNNITLLNKVIYPTTGYVVFTYNINNSESTNSNYQSEITTEAIAPPENKDDKVYPVKKSKWFTKNDSYNHKYYKIVTTSYTRDALTQNYEYAIEGATSMCITESKIITPEKIIEQKYKGIFKKTSNGSYTIEDNISAFSLNAAYENKGTFITEQTIKKNDGNTNPDDDIIFETIEYEYNSKLQTVSEERHFRNCTEIYNIHSEYSSDDWGNPVSTVDSRTGLKTEYSYQKHARIQNLIKTNRTTNVIPDPNDSSKSINDIVTTTYIYHNSSGIAVDPATLLASTHTGKPYVIRVTYNNGASVSKETIYDYYDDVSVDDGRIRSITEDNLMCTTYSYTNDNSPDPTNITITGVKDVENNSLIITNTFTFNSRGLLYTETSPSGLVTTYTYDAIDRPRTVNKSDESSTEIVYDDPLNKSIYTDENDNSSEFYFDEYGRLEKIKVLSGSNPETIYHYNSLGQIDTVTAPGTRVTSYTYDYMGRVKTVTYPYSNDVDTVLPFVKLEYDDSTNSVSIIDEKNVKIAEEKNNWAGRLTDAKQYAVYNGQTEIYNWNFTYDQAGNKITTTDPGGNITTNSYNGIGKQLQTILPQISVYDIFPYSSLVNISPTYSFVYDKYGNKTDDYGPIGNSPNYESIKENYKTTTIYDELNRPKQVEKRYTEATGIVNTMITKIKYDAAGNKIRVMERTGNNTWRTFRYDYDVAGRLIAEWVPAEPDADGNVWNITHYEYDKKGNKTAQTDPRGHSGYDGATKTYTNNPLYTTRYQYDAFGRLVATILPDNTNSAAIETYDDNPKYRIVYDESGQKVLETDPDGVSKGFTYTPRGFLYQEKLIATNGQETILATYVYNEKGQKISVMDNASNTTRYEYDSLGRLRKTIFPGNIIEEYKYDFRGNLIEVTDGRGVKRLTKYNNIGLVTEETISGNGKSTTTSYCYDPAGNQVTMTKPNGLTYQTTYDEQNRVKITIDPRGNSYVNTYDYLGNIKQKIDPMETLWDYTYAVDNSLTQLIASRTTSAGVLQYTSSYSYNKAGMMTAVTDNDNSINYSINHLGRVTAVSTTLDMHSGQRNYTTSYQYTDGGKLSSITYPEATQPIVYNYDYNGMLSGITGFVSDITYDSRLNLKSYKTGNNITQAFTYDSRNRLMESLATNQSVAASASSLSSYQQNSLLYQNYTYDPVSNITSINNKSFGYDEKSQLVSSVIPELILEKTATPGDPGAVSKDIRGDRGLNFGIDPIAEIKVDYQSNSVGAAFSPAAQVKRIEIVPDADSSIHRIENNMIDLYWSNDNLSFTLIPKADYSYSKDAQTGIITIELNERITMAILKLHVLFDERDINDNPVDHASFLNALSKILKIYQEGDRIEEDFIYDANGNRMRKDVSVVRIFSGNQLYYKDSEWLLSDGEWAFAYNNAGNMVKKGNWIQVGGIFYPVNSTEAQNYLTTIANDGSYNLYITFKTAGEAVVYWEYGFDLLSRMVEVKKNGQTVTRYGYSPDGIRTWKEYNGVKTHYIYQGDDLIFEKDLREGSISKNYVYAFGDHLARVDGAIGSGTAQTYYYLCDQVGSVRAITDNIGIVKWEGEYSAFGELIVDNIIDTDFNDNQRFGGKPYEAEVELYYFNARWHDPVTGRFISEDPVRDGGNWYGYCGNNPINNADPTGLEYEKPSAEFLAALNNYGVSTYWFDGQSQSEMYINKIEKAGNPESVEYMKNQITISILFTKAASTRFETLKKMVWEGVRDDIDFNNIDKYSADDLNGIFNKHFDIYSALQSEDDAEIDKVTASYGIDTKNTETLKMVYNTYGSFNDLHGAAFQASMANFQANISIVLGVFSTKAIYNMWAVNNEFPAGGARPINFNGWGEKYGWNKTNKTPKPYTNNRPSYGKGQVEKVWNSAIQPDGNVYDPNTGELLTWDKTKPRNGQWDMGHLPEAKYDQLHKKYMNGEIDFQTFIKEYRTTSNYRPESPSANRSNLY